MWYSAVFGVDGLSMECSTCSVRAVGGCGGVIRSLGGVSICVGRGFIFTGFGSVGGGLGFGDTGGGTFLISTEDTKTSDKNYCTYT